MRDGKKDLQGENRALKEEIEELKRDKDTIQLKHELQRQRKAAPAAAAAGRILSRVRETDLEL